jgi:uncharacterized MnhB-related membrane protein
MTAVQAVALIAVALGGTGVVFTPEPSRQALVSSVFGITLAVLFFTFQAPDVALSQIVVGSVALPTMILLAVAKVRRREQARRSER